MKLSVLRPRPRPVPTADPAGPGEPSPGVATWRRLLALLPRPQRLREELRRNTGLKLVSLVLAFFLWFSINVTERDAERMVQLPVSIRRLPSGLIVTNQTLKPVGVTLRGPRTILERVDEQRARVAVDLADAEPGTRAVELTTGMVTPELPRRLKVVRMEPPRVQVRIDRLVRRTVPVHAELAGMPAFGYTVAESRVVPDRVEVTGPAARVDDLKEIATEAVDLRGLRENVERTALLAWPGNFVTFSPDHVVVSVVFEEVMVSREFRDVEVTIANAEGVQARVIPPRVNLTVRGPQRMLANFKLPDASVTVDATGLAPGKHSVSPRVDLPPRLEIARQDPPTHTLEVRPKPPPSPAPAPARPEAR